jgi:hypothetical protein
MPYAWDEPTQRNQIRVQVCRRAGQVDGWMDGWWGSRQAGAVMGDCCHQSAHHISTNERPPPQSHMHPR